MIDEGHQSRDTPASTLTGGAYLRRGLGRSAGTDPSDRWRHLGRLAVFALAVVGGLAGLGVFLMHIGSDPLSDAHAYYDAATRLNRGSPLYPDGADPNSNHFYLYPPLFAQLLRPLALLPYTQFALAWGGIVVVSFVLVLRIVGVRSSRTWVALGILGIPVGFALAVAQAHIPMTLLLALGQPWSIAAAANLKLFPALIAIWWLGRRDLQAFGAFLGWTVLFVVVQLVIDPRDSLAFFSHVGLGQLGQLQNISPWVVSPWLWAAIVGALAVAAFALAPTRWGWPLAVVLGTVASPRLLSYMLTGLIAALREPHVVAPEPEEEAAEIERSRERAIASAPAQAEWLRARARDRARASGVDDDDAIDTADRTPPRPGSAR